MSLVDYGKDYHYAVSRLRDSIVSIKKTGVPVKVHAVNVKFALVTKLSKFAEMEEIKLHDLSMEPVKLGYVNLPRTCQYTYRIPVRKYRQGLSRENFGVGENRFAKGINYDSPRVAKTIMGDFPTLLECVESLMNRETEQIAFHRFWAIRRSKQPFALYYKGQEVGKLEVNVKTGISNATLRPKYNYLMEEWESVNV